MAQFKVLSWDRREIYVYENYNYTSDTETKSKLAYMPRLELCYIWNIYPGLLGLVKIIWSVLKTRKVSLSQKQMIALYPNYISKKNRRAHPKYRFNNLLRMHPFEVYDYFCRVGCRWVLRGVRGLVNQPRCCGCCQIIMHVTHFIWLCSDLSLSKLSTISSRRVAQINFVKSIDSSIANFGELYI